MVRRYAIAFAVLCLGLVIFAVLRDVAWGAALFGLLAVLSIVVAVINPEPRGGDDAAKRAHRVGLASALGGVLLYTAYRVITND